MDNIWLKYVDRSYQQIKAAVLARLPIELPEVTDHTESNLLVKMIDVWSGITEMISFYVDNMARETFLMTARRYASFVKIAHIRDYRIKSKVAASADLLFTISATHTSIVNIPAGTVVTNVDGMTFETLLDGDIPVGETEVTIGAKQYSGSQTDVNIGTSTGADNQSFEINDAAVADGTEMVKINSIFWTRKDTLAYSYSTDQQFVKTVSTNKLPLVRFGDNFNGIVPPGSQDILVTYKTTEGAAGNLGANSLTVISTMPSLPVGITLTVNNPERASGGEDLETLEMLRYRIPRDTRSNKRAITKLDFQDIAEIVGGVASAFVDFDCGKLIYLYISPTGGGIASSALLNDVTTALNVDTVRIVGTQLAVLAAGEVVIKLTVNVAAKPNYQNSVVKANVKAALLAYLSSDNQTINGQVQLSDIYETIELSDGVMNSNIAVMTAIPYPRPLGSTTTPLDWTVDVQSASNSTIKWKVLMTAPTTYQLFKDGSFLGNFNTGSLVSQTEVQFTVNANGYVVGDNWEFVTYAYFGTVVLAEPSMPISRDTDLTISVTGGI